MDLTVFPGTFNPVHVAHLIIAESVKDELKLDKILFIPSKLPPHRNIHLADPQDRFNMVNLAIQDNPSFEISDIEYRIKGKSYSYLTVKKLLEENSNITGKINFIIGSDAFALIDSWYEVEKLTKLVKFIIIVRPDNMDTEILFKKIKLKNFDYQIVKAPLMDISSSNIRGKIRECRSIRYLVPKNVEKYIFDRKLYLK